MKKEISGFYPFKHTKPCVYIANHKSYLDVIIIASLIPHKLKYLGKAEVFNWPFFGFLAKHSGQIPVKREDKDSRQKGYELMKKAIDDGFEINRDFPTESGVVIRVAKWEKKVKPNE